MLHIERTGLRNLQPNFLQGTGNLLKKNSIFEKSRRRKCFIKFSVVRHKNVERSVSY